MRHHLLCAALASGLVPLASAHAAQSCLSVDWTHPSASLERRPLTTQDLIRLRDIGPAGDDDPGEHVIGLSPDGRWLAFQISQADPEQNLYCLGMVLLSLDGDGAARFVDTGGDFMLANAGIATAPVTSNGTARVVTPRWSRDGTWFAFLKRSGGINRVWRANVATGRSVPITAPDLDIADFRVIASDRIIVQRASVSPAAKEALHRESLEGYHLDERFEPFRLDRPILPATEIRYTIIDASSGMPSEATTPDISLFDSPAGIDLRAGSSSQCAPSRRAGSPGAMAPTRIEMVCRGRSTILCHAVACQNSFGPMWMTRPGTRLRFMRREGWARTRTAVYEWVVGKALTRRLYATGADLIDCQPRREDELVCLSETSLEPRRVIGLDLKTGRVRTIVDVNPELASLTLGNVERIELTSNLGIPAFADLVYPTGYHPDRRYPLVIVQYQSRGFLRGGTGDEFPIQAFANAGFAVLSLQRPAPAGSLGAPADYLDMDRISLRGFADRRNVLSVIEQAIASLVKRGIVDPRAIGITGLSDGSSTVQFAALNSRLFAAGIVSGCCWEPSQAALLGPEAAARYGQIGWPGVSADAPDFWRSMSLVRNASRVGFPLLFHAADDEFRLALESFTALREIGKAADLFVYPDEYHIKWQPAHRLAAYDRSLAWFGFWLKGARPDDPRRRAEVERWAAMKELAPR